MIRSQRTWIKKLWGLPVSKRFLVQNISELRYYHVWLENNHLLPIRLDFTSTKAAQIAWKEPFDGIELQQTKVLSLKVNMADHKFPVWNRKKSITFPAIFILKNFKFYKRFIFMLLRYQNSSLPTDRKRIWFK